MGTNTEKTAIRVVMTPDTLAMADRMAREDAEPGTTPDRSAWFRRLVREEDARRNGKGAKR